MDSTDASATVLFGSRKNKIISGLMALLALALFSLLFYSIAIAPSKQPYRDARAQYKNVYNANVNLIKLGGSINASGATDEAFTKSTEALKAALKVLAAENEALAQNFEKRLSLETIEFTEGVDPKKALAMALDDYLSKKSGLF